MKRGDIVLMVAPGDLGKPRPGIVVQGDELGDETMTVLVCPISSEVHESKVLRPIIAPTTDNGLRDRSQIMSEKILALRRERLRRVLGKLEPKVIEQLDRALLIVLGLAR